MKGSLTAAEILSEEGKVRHQNPNQRHIGVIMTFDDHLGTKKHIGLSPGKGF